MVIETITITLDTTMVIANHTANTTIEVMFMVHNIITGITITINIE